MTAGHRRPALAVALLVLALVAGACTSGGGGDDNRAGGGPSQTVAPLPPTRSPAPHAVAGNPLGAKWDWSRFESFSPYLRRVTGGATFYELVWCDVERDRGQPDWSKVDEVAKESRDIGFSLYLKIRIGTCWATGGRGEHVRGKKQKTESAMPLDMNAYRDFVRAAVARYKAYGVHEWAIENEVNGESMWAGSPADYIDLATTAAETIRSVDPDAVIADAGISSTAYGWGIANRLLAQGKDDLALRAYQAYYERRFSTRGKELPEVHNVAELRAALQGDQARRNLAYLDVARTLAERHVVDVRQIHFYEKWSNVPALLDYLHAETPRGTAIEAWEVGNFWPDGPDDEHARAAEMVKTVTGLVAGGVRRVIWLPLAYDPGGRHPEEIRYGLLDPDGAVREAGRMLLEVSDLAHGSTTQAVRTSTVQGVAFERDGTSTLLVWSESGAEISPRVLPDVRVGLVGEPLKPAASGALQVGSSPMVLTVNRPLDQALRLLG